MTTPDKTEENPMVSFTKAMGLILTGSFVVKSMSPILYINGELNNGNCFTWAVGWLIVIIGVLHFLIIPFQSKSIFKSISTKFNSLSNILLPLLFGITLSQLVDLMSHINIIPAIIGLVIIALILVIGIISTLKKSFFNERNLIYMSVVLTGFSTISILLSDFEKVFLIKFSLVLSMIFILWAVYLMQKHGNKL